MPKIDLFCFLRVAGDYCCFLPKIMIFFLFSTLIKILKSARTEIVIVIYAKSHNISLICHGSFNETV